MSVKKQYPYILTQEIIHQSAKTFQHPWNQLSEIRGTHLSRLAGLKRTGVSIASVAPGKESFAYHSHHREEEWIYILAGQAVIEISGVDYVISTGDFVAFPTPSEPHLLKNQSDKDVVYLMGGENKTFEIADFPKLNKRMIRNGDKTEVINLSSVKPFGSDDSES